MSSRIVQDMINFFQRARSSRKPEGFAAPSWALEMVINFIGMAVKKSGEVSGRERLQIWRICSIQPYFFKGVLSFALSLMPQARSAVLLAGV